MSSPNVKAIKIGDTTITDTVIVLLYSASQQAFHVESFIDYMQSNMVAFVADKGSDWMLIGIFPDHKSCDAVFEAVANVRDARVQAKEFVENVLKSLGL